MSGRIFHIPSWGHCAGMLEWSLHVPGCLKNHDFYRSLFFWLCQVTWTAQQLDGYKINLFSSFACIRFQLFFWSVFQLSACFLMLVTPPNKNFVAAFHSSKCTQFHSVRWSSNVKCCENPSIVKLYMRLTFWYSFGFVLLGAFLYPM